MGFIDADRSSSFLNFPTDDSAFTEDFSVLPVFVPTDTLEHLKECGKATKKFSPGEAVAEMSSTKGLRLLPFVHDLQVSKPVDNNIIYVRALCWASYKKSVKYKVRITVTPNGKPKIIAALCDSKCPAGKSGCCCHVMAVIWKLDEMSRNNLLQNRCKDDRPCTSQPRKWGIPGKRAVMHEPIMASQLFKPRHQTDLPGRKRRGVLSTFYDPRPAKSRRLDPEAVENFRDAIFEANPSVPFGKMTPNSSDIVFVDSLIGKVAKGSALHLQLKDFNTPSDTTTGNLSTPSATTTSNLSKPSATTTSNFSTPSLTDTSYFSTPSLTAACTSETRSCLQPLPVIRNDNTCSSDLTSNVIFNVGVDDTPLLINQPFSLDEIRERCQEIKRNLFLNDDNISKIERETRGQSANSKWFDHRFRRITASKCHRVACPHKAGTSPSKIIKEVLNYNERVQTKAMREGIQNEDLIITQYTEKMGKEGHVGLEVTSCGFFVSKTHGFLGASPDGLVTDPSIENPLGLVEAKNIQVKKNESLMAALVRKGICTKDGKVKKSHQYYYQIQQQEFVVNRQWCDFVVRGSNGATFFKRVPYIHHGGMRSYFNLRNSMTDTFCQK